MPTKSIPLTGLDHFFLALEKHNGKSKTTGNTCRYFLELDTYLSIETLRNRLKSHALTQELAAIRLKKQSIISGSSWVKSINNQVQIVELHSDDKIPQEILEFNIDIQQNQSYFNFFLIHRTNNTSTVVLCWHHLLMDGYGACLYLSDLNQQLETTFYRSITEKFTFADARKAKKFIRNSSKPELSSVYSEIPIVDTVPGCAIISFSEEESSIISENALQSGAVFGQSTFFLAACGIAVKQILEKKGKTVSNFWVPMPQDKRKKMALGPVLSNHLSLLFFRLEKDAMSSGIHSLTKNLTNQMKMQIKYRISEKYNALMHFIKVIPTALYYRFIKGPHGGSLSSFLFTVAPEHPVHLDTFLGCNVVDALNTPPLTFPPGLTFAFAKHKTKTRIFVVYSSDVFSKDEIHTLGINLKELLLKRGE